MNPPKTLSRATLKALGTRDTHAVRVLLHSVHNQSQARLRCRNREYLFEFDRALRCHALDIPVSVWMHGNDPDARYRDNRGVCDDFRELPLQSFTIHFVKIRDEQEAVPRGEAAGTIGELRRLLSALGAPEQVERAFSMIGAGASAEELSDFVDREISLIQQDAPEETKAQRQARRMREAKAAKKAQLQTA